MMKENAATTGKTTVTKNIDPKIDKIESGMIGVVKSEKLRKFKGAILTTVANSRAK